MAGALHHRAGRKVARTALLALRRATRRYVILGRPAAAQEACWRYAKVLRCGEEIGQAACEEKAREEGGGQEEVRDEEVEDQSQKGCEEDHEEGGQEEGRQEEGCEEESHKEESHKEALGFAHAR